MGNALVVGVVTKLGEELHKLHNLGAQNQDEFEPIALKV